MSINDQKPQVFEKQFDLEKEEQESKEHSLSAEATNNDNDQRKLLPNEKHDVPIKQSIKCMKILEYIIIAFWVFLSALGISGIVTVSTYGVGPK